MRTVYLLLLTSFLTLSCNQQKVQSEEEIKAEITALFNGLYEDYEAFDVDKFTAYYQDDVIRMGTDGTYEIGKEIFKQGWLESAENYDMVLLDYSQPTVLGSQDQVVTFNTYHELFIEKATQDTTEVHGTWIGVWKKQEDGSWKLRMTTWH